MRDCIAPSAQTVTDGNDVYVFCAAHFAWFENYLNGLRIIRDQLVDEGVEFAIANRIIEQRIAREEL